MSLLVSAAPARPRKAVFAEGPPGFDEGLAGRIAAIVALRLGFLTLLLGATAFFYLRGDLASYPDSLRVMFSTIGAAYALGAIYAATLRAGRGLRRLAVAQIVFDQLTWTAIVYVSGGATSGATSFYALTCLTGAILIGPRGAALAAVTGSVAYALLCAGFALHGLSPPADQLQASYAVTGAELVYPLLVNLLGVAVVAILAGYLAERLQTTGGALEEANQRVLEAERLAVLGRLATGLAHEIRNPLGSISGSIEMLRESGGLSEEDRALCEIVHRESARLNNLVSDMLDLARPRVPHLESVDVATLARDVVALAARSERSGSGDVAVVYAGPDDPAPPRARCDGAQMRQVLWNLVRNAVQASAAGTRVEVGVAWSSREVRLSVTDHGAGIPPQARDRIFDAFYTTRSHGTGIGLAVVKRIIDEHAALGARIRVDAPTDGSPGAVFEVSLARAD